MILNEGQPEAWREHTEDDAAPTLYAERPPAILRTIHKKKYDLLFPTDFAGTLCARDGIKTGPRTPNGEDAYDKKLVVMKVRRKTRRFYSLDLDEEMLGDAFFRRANMLRVESPMTFVHEFLGIPMEG